MNIIHKARELETSAKSCALWRAIQDTLVEDCNYDVADCDWCYGCHVFHITVKTSDRTTKNVLQVFNYDVPDVRYEKLLALTNISEEDMTAVLQGRLSVYQLTVYDA